MLDGSDPVITDIRPSVYVIPTDSPEADGTLRWDRTTLVAVQADAGGLTGIGYSYASSAAARVIAETLKPQTAGVSAFDIPKAWDRMVRAVRNMGRPGIASHAVSAVDAALWDLKAKLLDLPLAVLLGRCRDSVAVYGSGGFTSYADWQLSRQLAGWVEEGIRAVKMKVGTEPGHDPERVRIARAAIGSSAELFVDANGAYSRKEALALAESFALYGVKWFEEPVSSDDIEGLRLLRDRAPGAIEIAAGEYGYLFPDFERLVLGGAVDVLQADATRCAGITGFMKVAALCEARGVPLSAHTAPSLHLAPACSAATLRHVEYFYDHVRIERLLFDGAATALDGRIRPDLSRPGLGIELKVSDAARFAA